ncbi:MAG: hypothetical protein WDW38_005334 [Sanguina aurantia]
MDSAPDAATLVICLMAIACMQATLVRPWKFKLSRTFTLTIAYWVPPVAGALLLVIYDQLGWADVWNCIAGASTVQPYGVLVLFLALAYISLSLDSTGCCVFTAMHATHASEGSSTRLLLHYHALSATLSALTSANASLLAVTPVICYLSAATRTDPAPYLAAQCSAAGTRGMLLPVSSPHNMVIAQAAGLSLAGGVKWRALPTLVEWQCLSLGAAAGRPGEAGMHQASTLRAATGVQPAGGVQVRQHRDTGSGMLSPYGVRLERRRPRPAVPLTPAPLPSPAPAPQAGSAHLPEDQIGAAFGTANTVGCLLLLALAPSLRWDLWPVAALCAALQAAYNCVVVAAARHWRVRTSYDGRRRLQAELERQMRTIDSAYNHAASDGLARHSSDEDIANSILDAGDASTADRGRASNAGPGATAVPSFCGGRSPGGCSAGGCSAGNSAWNLNLNLDGGFEAWNLEAGRASWAGGPCDTRQQGGGCSGVLQSRRCPDTFAASVAAAAECFAEGAPAWQVQRSFSEMVGGGRAWRLAQLPGAAGGGGLPGVRVWK